MLLSYKLKPINFMFRDIFSEIKNCVFPIHCLGCGVEGEWLCENCLNKIPRNGVFCCPVCHRSSLLGECCQNCLENSFLKKTIAVTVYQDEELIGKIVHNLKYNFAEELTIVLEKIISDFCKNYKFTVDYIVPVPLHRKRFAERGFNQAEIIAKILSQTIGIKFLNILERDRPTRQQAKLNRQERIKNTKDAFICKEPISGKFLLVDDVFTTGSTLQECARVLYQAGAEEVSGFTLARG